MSTYTIRLTERAEAELSHAAKVFNLADNKTAIKKALSLLNFAAKEVGTGGKIIAENQKENTRKVINKL